MKIIKTTLIFVSIAFSSLAFAQSTTQTKIEARQLSADKKITAKERPINNHDGYMGESRRILSKLNVKEIPADFPKYKEGQTREEYKQVAIAWMKENKNLLNPEFKKRFEEKLKTSN